MFYSYIRKLNSYLIISGRRGSHESRTSDSISSARTSTCWLTRCHPSPLLVVIIILVAVNDDFVQRPFSNLNCLAGCSIKSFWIAERWGSQEWRWPCLLRPSQGLWGDIHFLFSRIWYVLTFLITPSCILCPFERLWGDFNIFFLNSFTSTTFTFLIIPIVYCAHLKSFKVIISLSLLIRSNLKLVFYLSCFPYQYFHLYHFHFLHQYITRSSLVFITTHDVIILFCNLIMFVPQSLQASLFCNKCWQMKMERVWLLVIAIVKERLGRDATSIEIEHLTGGFLTCAKLPPTLFKTKLL